MNIKRALLLCAIAATALFVFLVPLRSEPPPHVYPVVCVVISATRPHIDYVTTLLRILQFEKACRIVVYDADPTPVRMWPRGIEVIRDPHPRMLERLSLDSRTDKYHDPPHRIHWRAKGALDYMHALEYAQQQPEPYALVLEDDAWPADDLAMHLEALVSWRQDSWLARVLFHDPEYDTHKHNSHGDAFEFKAVSVAMLYQRSRLDGLIRQFRREWQSEPSDFTIRNYQYEQKETMRVAVPSLAQHIGRASSLTGKQGAGCSIKTDFVKRRMEIDPCI